jgi:SAM-dependent methyltransferase
MISAIGSQSAEDFVFKGNLFMHEVRSLIGLRPGSNVLEVGCGCGRMARPLTRYISRKGTYDGIDVMRSHLGWCANEISTRFANFRFWHADIHSAFYNPTGREGAANYSFPFDSGSFDFVFLTSVFTHMLPDGVDRYMAEISRVLRPMGRALITYLLLNDLSRAAIIAKTATTAFVPDSGEGYWLSKPSVPETVVALDEGLVKELHQRHSLPIDRVSYGAWVPRQDAVGGQDMVVATRAR